MPGVVEVGNSVALARDVGRVPFMLTLNAFQIAAAAETLMTMSLSQQHAALTTGTSHAVPALNQVFIQSITAALVGPAGNTTAVHAIVRLRVNNAGAAVLASPLQKIIVLPGVAAALNAGQPFNDSYGDGWVLPAGAGIAITVECPGYVLTTAAPQISISISGYRRPL